MTAFLLGGMAKEIGLPKGVLNIVHGTGQKVGSPLVSSPLVKGISFTGSTQTGRYIAEKAAPTFKKVSLEMGGKTPILYLMTVTLKKQSTQPFAQALKTKVKSVFVGREFLSRAPSIKSLKTHSKKKH